MPTTARSERLKRFALTHVWLLPILLAALWLRTTGIGTEHLYGDEAEYAIVARYLSRDLTYLAYPDIAGMGAVPFVSQPPLILYTMAFSMMLFGATDVAAILPSILFGVATVAAVYAMGHRLGGRLMGLGSAAVMAVLPFHIEMSRRAMLDAGYVFFLTLTAYFCVSWLQTRTRRSAIGVGVAVACAALSKLPGVLAGPVALAVFVLGLAIVLVRKDKAAVKETLIQGGLATLPIAAGAALYLGLMAHLQALTDLMIKLTWQFGRVNTEYSQVEELTAFQRDWSWYFTDPHFSLQHNLLPIVFALALVGLVAVLARLVLRTRRPEDAVLPIFTFIVLGFFLYSDRKEGFYLLPLAPFAAVYIGYAADTLRRMLAWANLRFTPATARPTVGVAALALGVLLVAAPAYGAASESVDDFVRGADQQKYFGYGIREAAALIHERDPNAGQYGTVLGRFSLHWYNEQESYHWYVDHTYLESRIQSGELKYIVYEDYLGLAFDREYMRQLINQYNGEAIETFRSGWGEVTVFELHP